MPQFLIDKLKREYPGNNHRVYGTLNAIGAMHGNKETAKGREMERKHEEDKGLKPMAFGGAVAPMSWRNPQDEQDQLRNWRMDPEADALQPPPQDDTISNAEDKPSPYAPPQGEYPASDHMQADQAPDQGGGFAAAPAIPPGPAPQAQEEYQPEGAPQGPPAPPTIPSYATGPEQSFTAPTGPPASQGPTPRQQAYAQQESATLAEANKKIPMWRQIAAAVAPRFAGPLTGQYGLAQKEKALELQRRGVDTELAIKKEQDDARLREEQISTTKEARLAAVAQRLAAQKGSPLTAADRLAALRSDTEFSGMLSSDQKLEWVANGTLKETLKPDKPEAFGTVPAGGSVFNKSTGAISETAPQKDAKDLQRDDKAIALRQKQNLGQPLTPEETAFLKAYDKYVDQTKVQPGVQRMEVLAQTREYPVINKQTGQMEMRSASDINANKGLYAPAGPAASAMGKEAVFQDLHYNIDTARKAIQGLESMDAGTRAALSYALRHTDPASSIQTFLTGAIGTRLTPQQQEAVQALALLSENALSLRSVAGMGQGSDDLRSAIQATLPSGKSPTKGYALEQLNKFEQVVKRLETGVPGVRNPGQQPQPQQPQQPTAPQGATAPKVIKWGRDAQGRPVPIQ